jgi:hypothetical protein
MSFCGTEAKERVAAAGEFEARAEKLLAGLRREMNGAAVERMERAGIAYPLSYGVSTTDIRSAALRYAPDDLFARYLYTRNVRELRLAALFIADPASLSADDLPFWAAGVTNSEVAEYLAFALAGRSAIACEAFERWAFAGIGSEAESETSALLLRYCALMTMLRAGALQGDLSGWDFDLVGQVVKAARSSDSALLRTAAEKSNI